MQCPGVLFFSKKISGIRTAHAQPSPRAPANYFFREMFLYVLSMFEFFKECLSVGQKERGRIGRAFSAAERTAKEGAGLRRGGDFLKKRTKNRKGCKIALQIAEGLVK